MEWFLEDIVPKRTLPPFGMGERELVRLMYKFSDMPFAQKHGFQRGYAEPLEWMKNQFRDWASMLLSTTMYYDEKDATLRELYRRSLNAYAGIAPQNKIILGENKPVIRWDFPSLLQMITFLLTIALTDEMKPLRLCRGCEKVFLRKTRERLSVPKIARIGSMLRKVSADRSTQTKAILIKTNEADKG
jgi:hypothetical protein